MRFVNFYPYKFDWGKITAEAYDAQKNEITLIFNCDLRNEKNIENTVQYVVGRLCWGIVNFPPAAVIRMVFDIRGQEIIVSRSKRIKEGLLERIKKLSIMNNVMVEFLR